MTDIRNTLKKIIAKHNQAVIEDWEAMRKDADREPRYSDEQVINNLVALLQQSNREYADALIDEDDDIEELDQKMKHMGTPESVRDVSILAVRSKNHLRAELRKKNENT